MSLDTVRLTELITLARDRGATDLHVAADSPPALRVHGRIVLLDVPPIRAGALDAYLLGLASADVLARWTRNGVADFAQREGNGAPFRLHAYRTMGRLRLAFRFHPITLPRLEDLALPPIVSALATRTSGLVIFTGPTGSGKTTAVAALIDRINRSAERVILTAEDPVEYVHAPIRSSIAHSELGSDTPSYADAVHGFMRADPDVILIGEMRDRETMAAALSAAETGHLVLSTLHTNDAAQTIDRIIDTFGSDAQGQVRMQLAATIVAVISLRLVPLHDCSGRVAATEILVGTDAVRAMIRDGKTHQLRNAMSTGRNAGMRTLETSLSDLAVRGTISIETARTFANRPADVRDIERAAS
jgi:twitching motility protein PilT